MENFWEWLPQQFGPNLAWLGYLINFLVVSGIGTVIVKLGEGGIKLYKKRRDKKKVEAERIASEERERERLTELGSFFQRSTLERAKEYYIETKGQDIAPSRSYELSETHQWAKKEPLIPFFLEKAFASKTEDYRFYLVLGGSGMGKSTFMINLYLRYLDQTPEQRKYDIVLLPMGDPDSEMRVRQIVEEGKEGQTILLLDAFDEDAIAAKDYRKRMDDWIALVKNFREVVITSRTQFFPNEEAYSGELQVKSFDPANKGFHKFKLNYISPFDDEDIRLYLDKKYPRHTREGKEKWEKAKTIVDRSPHLMVRPMLLANIDDLLEDPEKEYEFTYEIYESLIEKWIEREAAEISAERRDRFKEELREFSFNLAFRLYQEWTTNKRQHLSPEQLAEELEKYELDLQPIEANSKSFLNRDGERNRKFSHKSIWEYFLAVRMARESEFEASFKSDGLDMAQKFLVEMKYLPRMVKVSGGQFKMGSNESDSEKPIHTVKLDSFEIGKYLVTERQWIAVMGNNPQNLPGGNLPVVHVSWEDCQKFIEILNTLTGESFRLPTEAEWEYAAGGGERKDRTSWAGTSSLEELDLYAWTSRNSENTRHPVGQKQPNQLGLYDMSGNVWEWCQDLYGAYEAGLQVNPSGPEDGGSRVRRCGSWRYSEARARVTVRNYWSPDDRDYNLGFRLARSH